MKDPSASIIFPGPVTTKAQKRRAERARLIANLRRRDGDRCQLCGATMDFSVQGITALAVTLDHVVPESQGGKTVLRNLHLAHMRCNTTRGSMSLERFWQAMADGVWPYLVR